MGLKRRYSEEPGIPEPEEETGQMERNRRGSLSSAEGGKTDAVSTDTQMSPQPPMQPRC